MSEQSIRLTQRKETAAVERGAVFLEQGFSEAVQR